MSAGSLITLAFLLWAFTALALLAVLVHDSMVRHTVIKVRPKPQHLRRQGEPRSGLTVPWKEARDLVP